MKREPPNPVVAFGLFAGSVAWLAFLIIIASWLLS